MPDELQWSVAGLEAEIESGRVLLLDVVAAVKNAMPQAWLADHGMAEDYLSIVFSKSVQEILDVYAAALHAWGAADVAVPKADAAAADDDGDDCPELSDECVAGCDFTAVWQVMCVRDVCLSCTFNFLRALNARRPTPALTLFAVARRRWQLGLLRVTVRSAAGRSLSPLPVQPRHAITRVH